MKKYISGLFLLGCFVLLLSGCNSDKNIPEMAKINYPKLTPDPASDQLINMEDPSLFHGKLNVDLYFPNKDLPQSATLVIAKNGDYDNVKQIQEITTFPTVVDITGSQLESLFSEPIALNDVFEIGMDTKYNGVVYKAFNSDGISYSADLWNLPGSNPIHEYDATFLLDLDDFTGSFHVDDNEFWGTEYDVMISRSQTVDNQLVVEGMLGDDGDGSIIYIDVNMATQVPKINNQVVLKFLDFGDGTYDTNLTYSGTGKFNIPDKTITFSIGGTGDMYYYGDGYALIFTKN